MKNKYVHPEMELLDLKATDILTNSVFDPDNTGEDETGYNPNW